MTKKYKCIVGSPEIPKGTIVEYMTSHEDYKVTEPQYDAYCRLEPWQVEGNECWEEVKEETISSTPTKRWKPILGQPFYCIDESGFVEEDDWDGTLGDERMWEIGNCFQTEQQARDEVMRRESIANAWRPKDNDEYWVWSWVDNEPYQALYGKNVPVGSPYKYIGACHPTKEACREWGETYAKYFLPKTA